MIYSPKGYQRHFKYLVDKLIRFYKPEDVETFLCELFTRKELENILTRLEIIEMLQGGNSQRTIAVYLGVSLSMINRISKLLQEKRKKWY